jgi:hypothetical protein
VSIVLPPDAMMIPKARKRGERFKDRVASIADIAEPILGGRAFIRILRNEMLFVTRDPSDTMFFARDHPRQQQSRYRWEKRADGTEWGWLLEG